MTFTDVILHNDDAHRLAFRNANGGNIDLKTQRRQVVIEIGNQLIVEFTQHIKTQWFDKSNQFVPPLLDSRWPCQEQQRKKQCDEGNGCDECNQYIQDLIPQEVSNMGLRTHRPFAGYVFVGSTG